MRMCENKEFIRIKGLCKAFDEKQVLKDFSAEFPKGELSCIMAPSGGGKTTLLRILMGLEKADQGEISGLKGMRQAAVFQEERLCEHLSPVANIRLVNLALSREVVIAAMEQMALTDCADQPVCELSGGMRRRVVLLRALLAEHDLLLMDEPFKGLDADTKMQVMAVTREMIKGRTVLMVTHEEAECEFFHAADTVQTL